MMRLTTGGLIALLLGTGPLAAQMPFDVGGPFALTDHTGAPRTQADPDGLPQLLFFGYANCPGICTAALPLMADVTDILADEGLKLRPVMITVDPARDTLETMGEKLAEHHRAFIGLTGDPKSLDAAYKAFSIEHALAYEDPEYGPVYTHGSFIYLLDGAGEVLTLIPPIMDATKAAEIARKYVGT